MFLLMVHFPAQSGYFKEGNFLYPIRNNTLLFSGGSLPLNNFSGA
jgi:hypothetical protein